jgi:hypothetical protein
MSQMKFHHCKIPKWLAGFIVGIMLFSAPAQSQQEKGSLAPPASVSPAGSTGSKTSPYHGVGRADHARDYYQAAWGVDSLGVRTVESGQLIRFNYRVVNAEKAQALNDKKANPYLVGEASHVKLVVPSMEKVGQLRQSSTPEAGRSYWMVFSNKGGYVKPGDRVSVVIGTFRASGLVVQ